MVRATKLTKLPKDQILVKNGKVIRLVEYTLWNGVPEVTLIICYNEHHNNFTVLPYDPEHDILPSKTCEAIEMATTWFERSVANHYNRLFKMRNATALKIRKLRKQKSDRLRIIIRH